MDGIIIFFKGFYKGIKNFGSGVVNITNFILLIPVYFIGIGFSSIFAKITGKSFLDLKKKKQKSYWVDKKNKKPSKEDCYNQF